MFDPSQAMGGGPGGPPPQIAVPGQDGPPGDDTEPDEAAEKAAVAAIKRWLDAEKDPKTHNLVATLYQKATQIVAQEQAETHQALGLSGVQKLIARNNGQ